MSSLETLPQTVSIEFPLKVTSHEKALKSIGGAEAIANAITNPDKKLELRLRDDPFHHPINSSRNQATNVILEIKVPTEALKQANGNIQQALALSNGNYIAKPVLFSATNFKFREMADFQYNTQGNQVVEKLRDSIMSQNLANIMKYTIPRDSTLELLPPPRFSQQSQPVFYNYKQPSSVAVIQNDNGEVRLFNKTKAAQLKSLVIRWDEPAPKCPREDLDPNPRLPIKECIEELKVLFDKRPTYTRRAINSLISEPARRSVRYALPYVAYFYKSGPWRAAYIKYGHDPNSDKSFAKYQVEHFRFTSSEEDAKPEHTVYTFDGKIPPTTRMLQLCDVSEPFLRDLIDKCQLKDAVSEDDGWFEKADMAAIRKVLKTELDIARGDRSQISPERLQELADDARLRSELQGAAASQQDSRMTQEEEEEDDLENTPKDE